MKIYAGNGIRIRPFHRNSSGGNYISIATDVPGLLTAYNVCGKDMGKETHLITQVVVETICQMEHETWQ